MKYLHLTDRMNNCFKTSKQYRWEFPNLEFPSESQVALSSMTIDFKTRASEKSPVQLSTNLIERDMYNPGGILITFPAHVKDITHQSNLLEFWRIDSMRPRFVVFTFDSLNVDTVSFFSAVIAIKTE